MKSAQKGRGGQKYLKFADISLHEFCGQRGEGVKKIHNFYGRHIRRPLRWRLGERLVP